MAEKAYSTELSDETERPSLSGSDLERERRSGIRAAQKEARREHRAHLEIGVRFHLQTEAGIDIVGARARNISLGGMFIETDRPAPFRKALVLELALPGIAELARIECTVRWTSPEGMGVQFGVMGARETHGLVKLLEP
jgi:hypothetical protein